MQLINKMDNTGYEKVQFILKKFSISNIDKLVKFVVANQKAKIVQVSQKLQFFAEEEQQLDG